MFALAQNVFHSFLFQFSLSSISLFLVLILFQCFSDPENVLQKWLKAQNIIEVAVNSAEGEDVYFEIKKYRPHGMVQPAVLFVKPDMSVLAKWVQIPTEVSPLLHWNLDNLPTMHG